MICIKTALSFGAEKLKHIADRPRFEAEILLSFLSGLSRTELITKNEAAIEFEEYEALIARREAGEPIEYITGEAGFYSRVFLCEKGVLIPRPETEILIDKTAAIAKEFFNPAIAEIGVGSGVISVMLAILLPNAKIIATDINEKAIDLTRKNAAKFGVENRIESIKTNLLDGVNQKIDILVSNPPYIAEGYLLPKPVTYEPRNALFGGERGTEILEKIIELKIGAIACECGYDQECPLREILTRNGYKEIEFYKDCANLTRGFTAKL